MTACATGGAHGGLQRGQERVGHQHGLRTAVLQHVGVVVCGEQRVHGHRHDAREHGTQKAHGPVAAVVHQQQHALFAPHAAALQGGRHALDALGQRAITQLPIVVDVGDFVGALRVARKQVLGEIEVRAGCGDCG